MLTKLLTSQTVSLYLTRAIGPLSSNETCSTSGFKSKINTEHLKDQPKQKLLKNLGQHCNEVENKSEPVLKIPIKHSIHLKYNIPVSLPARPLPYSQREEVLKQVETLSREGIIATF